MQNSGLAASTAGGAAGGALDRVKTSGKVGLFTPTQPLEVSEHSTASQRTCTDTVL